MPVSPTAAAEGPEAFENNPIGTGAFQFVSRTLQDNITLTRNDNYWDGTPALEEIVIRPFPDGSVRYANLLSGAVDLIYPVEPRDYIEAQDNEDVALLLQPTNGWRILVLDTTEPPFDDPDFRRALAATIDREAISQFVFNGLEPPATGPIPASSPYYTEPTNLQGLDVALAQEISGDSTFALTTIARSPEDQLTQLIQAMASQGDIELSIEPVEVGEYLRRNTSGEYEATTMQWSGQPDPDGNITSFFITDGFWNWSGYSNPDLDVLLTQAQTETDVATRRDLYAQALQTINEDVPVIWLTNQVRLVATQPAVEGLRLLPNTGIMELENVMLTE
jgi:peptide/nickel transport system substrate-binding protein